MRSYTQFQPNLTLTNEEYNTTVLCHIFSDGRQPLVEARSYIVALGYYLVHGDQGKKYPSVTNFNASLINNGINKRFYSGDYIDLETLYEIQDAAPPNSKRQRITTWLIDTLINPSSLSVNLTQNIINSCPFTDNPTIEPPQHTTKTEEVKLIFDQLSALFARLQTIIAT